MEDQMQTPPVPPEAPPPVAPKMSGMAIAAFVLAFLCAPVGLVLAIIAVIQIEASKGLQRGNGLAIASIIISVLMFFSAIPAAILFPVFMQARSKAQETRCASNVKQLSAAMMMYANDWSNCYPTAGAWNEKLASYTKNTAILHCPTDKTEGPSYAMNAVLSDRRASAVKYPAHTVMLFESRPGPNRAGGKALLPDPPRHDDGYVIGFADGHTLFVTRQSSAGLRWDLSP